MALTEGPYLYLTLFICSSSLAQSIHLDSSDVPMIGREFTLICNTSSLAIKWFRNNKQIAWSENQYTSVNKGGCSDFTANPERYIFKQCGVKHELTIKSLNFDLDNRSVWRCQNFTDSSKYSNDFTLILGLPSLYEASSTDKFQLGASVTFSVKYLADKAINVVWNHAGENLQTSNRVTIREEPSEISDLYNNNIKLSGIKTTLTITLIDITDQGNYTCNICNQCGCSHAYFQLTDDPKDYDEDDNIGIILAVVVPILVVVLIIVGVLFIIKYRKYKESKQSENSIYESTVATPDHLYEGIAPVESPHSSSEYDRPVRLPTQETEYLQLGSHNQYENTPNQPATVYYNTASETSMDESTKAVEHISNTYENQN